MGARFLDGYAGTGAVGIEALSRGASHVTFVDSDRRATELIQANLRHCGLEEGYAIIRVGFAGAGPGSTGTAFDIISLTPPYGAAEMATALTTTAGIASAETLVVVEHAKRDPPPAQAGALALTRDLMSGDSALAFYRVHVRAQRFNLYFSTQHSAFRIRPQMSPVIAIYPGSFDPITIGHVDIIQRGSRLFDRIVIAVLINVDKAPLFTVHERVDVAREVFRDRANVEVDTFDGLLVDYARRRQASVIVRGLRAVSDFEYEMQMALMNRRLNPDVETVFMMPAEPYTYVSSRLVKEVVALGGSVKGIVPDIVERRLREKKLARETLRA